ncbi:MAG TPA: hypothetical protein VEG30_13875 [Terriglobales bacterium]|nr:hypothetical protein [Terriglobales bacterium]
MRTSVLVLLAMGLLSACAFAVDGVILINNATVLAAGGYPYTISQPGSYKLSGNLVAPLNKDTIFINADNVTLDLAGFNVQCSVQPQSGTINAVRCITGPGGLHNVSVRNGTVTATAVAGADNQYQLSPVAFVLSDGMTLEEVKTETFDPAFSPLSFNLSTEVVLPANSLVRNNTFFSGGTGPSLPPSLAIDCPSVVVENILVANFSLVGLGPAGCVVANNVKIS